MGDLGSWDLYNRRARLKTKSNNGGGAKHVEGGD